MNYNTNTIQIYSDTILIIYIVMAEKLARIFGTEEDK